MRDRLSPFADKVVLVLGATGLIGSNVCRALQGSGAALCRTVDETEPLGSADFIIHAAGYAQPVKFLKEPVETLKIHACAVPELVEHWLKPGGRFLYLSSSEVTIGSTNIPHTEDDIGTTSPAHVRSSYIEGKRCGEAFCHAYRSQGVNATIARVSLAYGPGFQKGDERAINTFIRKAIVDKRIDLLDDGQARRTFGFIDDVVEMLLTVWAYGTQPIYNVSGVSGTSILGLARLIAETCGDVEVTAPQKQDGVPGGPADVRLDLTRYDREFGLPEFVPLDIGLARTIDYARGIYA